MLPSILKRNFAKCSELKKHANTLDDFGKRELIYFLQSRIKGITAFVRVIDENQEWSPWLNVERAKTWAISNFNAGQIDRNDACGVIDAVEIKKSYSVIGFVCYTFLVLKPMDSLPQCKNVFVSAVGLVFKINIKY